MQKYDHQSVEPKWQKAWEEQQLYRLGDAVTKPYYLLVEFPYPSGDLHVGHWHAFSVPDIFARFKRMQGHDVLYPIGFDAFGLPAENAAIKHGKDPRTWTEKNIESMSIQLRAMGNSFDWDRSVQTIDPKYYKWTQWIFTQLLEKGLAYQKESLVNWDPVDKTVLANEQVLPDGTADRSGAVVEQKLMKQWFLKITNYADTLIDGLEDLDWPQEIKDAQRHWVGRSRGAEIPFTLKSDTETWTIPVFTTRPDTLMGVTFLAIAPEKLEALTSTYGDAVASYIETAKKKRGREREIAQEKTGVLTQLTAEHPITKEELPVYVADYVLAEYGTGLVMGVPAHDERDKEFAELYNLPIVEVLDADQKLINSGEYNDLTGDTAKEVLTKAANGSPKTTYRLHDWSVGRQRYWGCPIPVVYDPEGNPHAVPVEHLPWELPSDVDHTPTGEPPLARSEELKKRTEEIFGEGWTPEVETLDTFMDSSWYFLRYLDPTNEDALVAPEIAKQWLPINRYSGGNEHTTMHVLYARFIANFLYDIGVTPVAEPFAVRMNRGLILGPDGKKMSKSKGNTINPDDLVQKYGADTVKSYLAFIGPYNEVGNYPWNTDSMIGIRKFFDRVWVFKENLNDGVDADTYYAELQKAIKKVTEDIEQFKFHTALATLMSFMNMLGDAKETTPHIYKTFVQLLAPFAPHLTEEIWQQLGEGDSIHKTEWPQVDEAALTQSEIVLAVQINGKMRGTITTAPEAPETEVLTAIEAEDGFAKHLEGKKVIKTIYKPGKVINILTT